MTELLGWKGQFQFPPLFVSPVFTISGVQEKLAEFDMASVVPPKLLGEK